MDKFQMKVVEFNDDQCAPESLLPPTPLDRKKIKVIEFGDNGEPEQYKARLTDSHSLGIINGTPIRVVDFAQPIHTSTSASKATGRLSLEAAAIPKINIRFFD